MKAVRIGDAHGSQTRYWRRVSEIGMIMISMAYPVAALFPLVFSLRLLDCLPLHIRWRIRATALERYNMVNDVARPPIRVSGFPHELPLRRRAAGDLPVSISLHHHRTGLLTRGSGTNARIRRRCLLYSDARRSSVLPTVRVGQLLNWCLRLACLICSDGRGAS